VECYRHISNETILHQNISKAQRIDTNKPDIHFLQSALKNNYNLRTKNYENNYLEENKNA